MINRLQWLHISDLHFGKNGAEKEQFSQKVMCKAIIRQLKEEADRVPNIHFVLITGDIAFSGKNQQYEEAQIFFEELSKVLSISLDKFFFVPGNHDVDRSINSLSFDGACLNCSSQQGVDQVLGNIEFNAILNRQQDYWKFVEALTKGQQRTYTQNRLAYLSQLSIEGLKISLMGLNTSWLCGRDGEVGKLLIGERQVIDLFELTEKVDSILCIGIAHHPINWLYEWDQATCRSILLPKIDFYHHGHLHQPEVYLSSVPSSPCLTVAAGSVHASRFYHNSYNMVALDLDISECTVSQFEYSVIQGRYNDCKSTPAQILLKGKIPGDLNNLQEAINSAIPNIERYAGYMSALLSKYFYEVPVQISGIIVMMAPDAIDDTTSDEINAFLKLHNRLRLYEAAISLEDRIKEHQLEIKNFADYLDKISKSHPKIGSQITDKNLIVARLSGAKPVHERSFAIELLEELKESQAWPILEAQARRYAGATGSSVAKKARFMLIEALIHSDQTEKRTEGVSLAKIMIEDPATGVDGYLLAAVTAERVRDDIWAEKLATTMLSRWHEDSIVVRYVRDLSLRLGSKDLREALEILLKKGDVN